MTDITMHTCPRRTENGMADPSSPLRGAGRGLDGWWIRDGYRACTYCGSLHPDDFMAYARSGSAELGPTDKSYKVYVTDPQVTYQPTQGSSRDLDEDGDIIMSPVGERRPAKMKFYFQHLDHAQQHEFVDLYNARPRRWYDESSTSWPPAFKIVGGAGDPVDGDVAGMAVGYPGYFYTLPFFMTRGAGRE